MQQSSTECHTNKQFRYSPKLMVQCHNAVLLIMFVFLLGKHTSGINTALVFVIIFGVTLAVSLVGFTTVTVLLIKSKAKVQQTTATTANIILDRIASEAVENRLVHDNNITTSENVAYAVHLMNSK